MRTDYQLRGGSISRILKKMLRATASAVVLSGASTMLAAETQGLAIDFTDIYFLAATGHAGSAKVIDLTTPANNYNSHLYGLLTNAGTLKLTRQSDGVYRFQAHNICLQSETFSASPWASYFMAAATSTTLTFQAYAFAQQFQSFTAIAGATYEFGVEARVSSGAGKCRVKVNDGGDVFSSDFDLTTDWRACSITRTVGQASCAVGISNGTDAIARTIEVRRAYIRRTPCASIYLSTTSAAKYALPFEWGVDLSGGTNASQTVPVRATTSAYNKTTYLVYFEGAGSVALSGGYTGSPVAGTPLYITSATTSLVLTVTGTVTNLQVREFLGVLVEPQATNLCIRSTEFANGVWVGSGITVTSDSTLAPDGTNTADTLDATSNAYIYCQNQNQSGTQTFTASIYLKGTPGDKIGMRLINANTSIGVTSVVTLTASWERYTLTGTLTFGSFEGVTFGLETRNGVVPGTGSAVTCYAWNAQLETGSVATSPIITYGSTVTRAADSGITLSTAAIPFSAAAGTLFATISHRDTSLCYAACIDSGSTANQIALAPTDGDNSRNFVITSNVTQASDADINVNVETTGKCAFAWASNDTTISTNGSIGTNDTSVTLPTVTTVRIGDRFGGGRSLNGYIKKLMYLPRRMSNAELQAITV